MSTVGRDILIAIGWFCGLPFLVSGAFWLSPWLGWPMGIIAAPLWLGSVVSLARLQEALK